MTSCHFVRVDTYSFLELRAMIKYNIKILHLVYLLLIILLACNKAAGGVKVINKTKVVFYVTGVYDHPWGNTWRHRISADLSRDEKTTYYSWKKRRGKSQFRLTELRLHANNWWNPDIVSVSVNFRHILFVTVGKLVLKSPEYIVIDRRYNRLKLKVESDCFGGMPKGKCNLIISQVGVLPLTKK